MVQDLNLSSTWKSSNSPRGNRHNKTENKTTISLYLDKKLVETAKNRGLNLSSVMNQALSSILDYIQTQNIQTSSNNFSLSPGSLFSRKEKVVPRAGFEPATTRSSASPSATKCNWVERSPRLSYLGTVFDAFWMTSVYSSLSITLFQKY